MFGSELTRLRVAMLAINNRDHTLGNGPPLLVFGLRRKLLGV